MRIRGIHIRGVCFYILHWMVFLGGLYPAEGFSQDSGHGEEVRRDLEEALEYLDPEDSGGHAGLLSQRLAELAEHPVNINTAEADVLLQVPGLNLKHVRAVLDYRERVRPFESVEELLEVRGIGESTLEKARPYVTAGSRLQLARRLYSNYRYWTHRGKFQAYTRYQQTLQQAKGYVTDPGEGGFTGSPGSYYQRIGYRSDHLSMNLTQEKDAGEPLASPLRFDHTARHFALRNNGPVKMLVGGDYSLSFGQGLLLWNGGMFGKGSDVTGAANRKGGGVRPYSSSREGNYYRGVAATVGNTLQFSGFYSRQRLSASLISPDTTRFPSYDGYHRTLSERQRAGTQGQQLWGGRLQLELPVGMIGATGYQTKFDRVITAGDAYYARHSFEGRTQSALGMDFRMLTGPAILFGEVGRSRNGGYGVIAGVESPVGPDSDLSLVYRHYQEDFQSIAGSGFAEQSGIPQNEEGFYLGLRHRIGRQVTLSAYMDQFQFPGPRYGLNRASRGYEWLGKIEVDFPGGLQMYLQARSDIKGAEYEMQDPYGRALRALGTHERLNLRAHLEYQVSRLARLRTRAEMVHSHALGGKNESGYLLYQDLRLQVANPLALNMRVTMFDTESYASRLYQYENDLLYVFSSRALFNRGQRLYMMLHYRPHRSIEFWGKYGITAYEDALVVGSGMNQITGDTRSEMGLQGRVRF